MSYALALVQARMGSTRLPGKCMADLCGSPVLAHVLRRVKAAEMVKHTVLAIPDTPENDVLAELGKAEGVDVYRGSEDDVLGRLFWASQLHADDVVLCRLTGEDACKDPLLIDRAITAFVSEWGRWQEEKEERNAQPPPQYLHLGGPTWPLGMDVEVVTRLAFGLAYQNATLPDDREHAGMPYIRRQYGVWTLKDDPCRRTATTRLTVDTPEDLAFVRGIYEALYPQNPLFSYPEILAHLQAAA